LKEEYARDRSSVAIQAGFEPNELVVPDLREKVGEFALCLLWLASLLTLMMLSAEPVAIKLNSEE
tara:strand:- start:933 stop:1127 length:195 start_codon:yes stop_codon:yes gene_type:complete